MRTISVLIAATFCALALSGAAMARDSYRDHQPIPSPAWLEFRAAFAAEHLWPTTMGIREAELVEAQMGNRKDADKSVAVEDTNLFAKQRGSDASRKGRDTKTWIPKTSKWRGIEQ